MKNSKIYIAALLVLLVLFSCKDEDEVSGSLIGKWYGNKSDFKINPDGIIPAFTKSEDNFPVQLEFKSDGTLILTDDKTSTTGSYELNGQALTININYIVEFIGLDGTYAVEELTNSHLRVSIEKDGNYEHPDTGQKFDGTIKATLFFNRQAN